MKISTKTVAGFVVLTLAIGAGWLTLPASPLTNNPGVSNKLPPGVTTNLPPGVTTNLPPGVSTNLPAGVITNAP